MISVVYLQSHYTSNEYTCVHVHVCSTYKCEEWENYLQVGITYVLLYATLAEIHLGGSSGKLKI